MVVKCVSMTAGTWRMAMILVSDIAPSGDDVRVMDRADPFSWML